MKKVRCCASGLASIGAREAPISRNTESGSFIIRLLRREVHPVQDREKVLWAGRAKIAQDVVAQRDRTIAAKALSVVLATRWGGVQPVIG